MAMKKKKALSESRSPASDDINPLLVYVAYSRADWSETTPWLEENVGEFNKTWYKLGRDAIMYISPNWRGDEYLFLRDEDRALFILKWS